MEAPLILLFLRGTKLLLMDLRLWKILVGPFLSIFTFLYFYFLSHLTQPIIYNYDFSNPLILLLLLRKSLHFRHLHNSHQLFPPSPDSNSTPLSMQEIIHQLSLFEAGISPFDYDYYHSSGFWLIAHQKKLPLSDIMLVLRLGQRHNIRNSLIWSHFQS